MAITGNAQGENGHTSDGLSRPSGMMVWTLSPMVMTLLHSGQPTTTVGLSRSQTHGFHSPGPTLVTCPVLVERRRMNIFAYRKTKQPPNGGHPILPGEPEH